MTAVREAGGASAREVRAAGGGCGWEALAGAARVALPAPPARDSASRSLARAFLVINPGSCGGTAAETAARYLALLAGEAYGPRPGSRSAPRGRGRAGDRRPAHEYTRDLDDARMIALRALAAGHDPIVAIGGDGTINRVLNALMEHAGRLPAGSAAPRLGVLYAGTSPDFCRFHGLPTDPENAVARLRQGESRAIDVCRSEHCDAQGAIRAAFFASSSNIGLGAGIASRANRLRPRLGDAAGTALASVLTIAGRRPQRVRLLLDGRPREIPALLNLTVGKNPYLAGGLKLDLPASPDDGRLFVFAVCGIGRLGLLAALPRIYSGAIARDPRFLLTRAERVRVEPAEGARRWAGGRARDAAEAGRGPAGAPAPSWPTEFDGDPAGWCPAEIRVLPRAVQLIGGRP